MHRINKNLIIDKNAQTNLEFERKKRVDNTRNNVGFDRYKNARNKLEFEAD